jgi:hypothetical protein
MSARLALIIANTEYTDPGLARLTSPGKDAKEFARVLDSPEICGFDDVTILFNETTSQVNEAIDYFFSLKKPDDLLLLYFSGHGVRDEYGSLYLAVKNTNHTRLRSTAIKSDFIRDAMDQSRSKRQVLILDCCNSGAFAQGTKAARDVSIGTASAFEGTGYGRAVLTASDSTQVAWEGDKVVGEIQNSLFTHFLVKGLEGGADQDGDGRITVDELYDYAYEQIINITPKQTPGKWSYKQQGEIVLRQNMRVEDIKPIPLPDHLTIALENPDTDVRLGAIQSLTKLLIGKNMGLARSAREALEKIAKEDDSYRARQVASQTLLSVRPAEQMPTQIEVQEQKPGEEEAAAEEAVQRKEEPELLDRDAALQNTEETAPKVDQQLAEVEVAKKDERETIKSVESGKIEGELPRESSEKTSKETPAIPWKFSRYPKWVRASSMILGVILLALIGFFALNSLPFRGSMITPEVTNTIEVTTDTPSTLKATPSKTFAETPIASESQPVVIPEATETSKPLPPPGGADKIAFVAKNDIWMMNIDGTDLKQLTTDSGAKSDLQWLPDGETIIFISGKSVKTLNTTTNVVETLTTFPTAFSLDAFRVSHDGKQVMMVLNHEIFVVPFDIQKLMEVHKKSDLLALNGCINHQEDTESEYYLMEALWSADDKLVAWLYKVVAGRLQSDVVGVFNIQSCNPATIQRLDAFPGGRFTPKDYQDNRTIPSVDWNGDSLFVFNTFKRNSGWGELYVYDLETLKGTLITPIDKKCCYRDARWSPDGTYLFFAFQNESLAPAGTIELYYVLYGDIGTGRNFAPLQLKEDLFANPREGPQPALRPAQ